MNVKNSVICSILLLIPLFANHSVVGMDKKILFDRLHTVMTDSYMKSHFGVEVNDWSELGDLQKKVDNFKGYFDTKYTTQFQEQLYNHLDELQDEILNTAFDGEQEMVAQMAASKKIKTVLDILK